MESQHAVARHYAILIGINAYPTRPLTSCVRDVQMIKECLESKLSSVDVQTLTASKSLDPEIVTPLEPPERWPTCHNVTLAFERIIRDASSGDFVYIHYSGHGTRIEPCYNISNHSTGDLALVLLKGDQSSEPFLHGPRLARLLKFMTDKELVVTLVLDCCFSATVYRNSGPSIRYLPESLAVASTRSLNLKNNLTERSTSPTNRTASMRDSWLLEPDRYAILAACGPDEKAKGGSDASKKGLTYGALSHFLFQALSDHGLQRKHKDIHRDIRAQFWESCKPQHPVLYGNGEQGFFGPVKLHDGARSISVVKRDGRLQLLAGQPHGFRDGDHFTLFPSGSINGDRCEDRPKAQIICAGALTSQLEMVGTQHDVQTGWIAEPLTGAYLTNFPIQLAPDLPQHDEWLAALNERSLSTVIDNYQPPTLQVRLNNDDEYEILDHSGQKLINLPAMPRDQVDTRRICDVLEHLTWFRMARNLINHTPTAAFRASFDIQIKKDISALDLEKQIEVRHNSVMELSIENRGDKDLYVHVFNLDSFWRVKGILRATYEKIPPRKDARNGDIPFVGRFSKKIRMTVPPMMEMHGSCEDVVKIFVTSQPTSFDLLELPNLDGIADTVTRNRSSGSNSQVSEDWVSLNILIRIFI